MADESNNSIWGYLFGGVAAVWAFVQWYFSTRKKERVDSDKTGAETDIVRLEFKIKNEDYYKKKFDDARLIIDKLEEQNRVQAEQINKLQEDNVKFKRTITTLKTQLQQ
jgi:hypothetical protein